MDGKRRREGAAGLKRKIAVCIFIVIVVLIIRKFDGQEKNRIIGAVAEYYGRDYSVEDVVSAMSEGLGKAEKIPEKLRGGISQENGEDAEKKEDAKETEKEADAGDGTA